MLMAERVVRVAELVLGQIIDAALGMEGATAPRLAAPNIGAQAAAIATLKQTAAVDLRFDVLLEEVHDAQFLFATLDEIRAEVQAVAVHHHVALHVHSAEDQLVPLAAEAQHADLHHGCVSGDQSLN